MSSMNGSHLLVCVESHLVAVNVYVYVCVCVRERERTCMRAGEGPVYGLVKIETGLHLGKAGQAAALECDLRFVLNLVPVSTCAVPCSFAELSSSDCNRRAGPDQNGVPSCRAGILDLVPCGYPVHSFAPQVADRWRHHRPKYQCLPLTSSLSKRCTPGACLALPRLL